MGLSAASDAVDREPAIDDQLGASDVYRLVGREEQRRVSDIPGIAHAPIGHCSSRRRTISSALPPYAAMTPAACTIGVFIIPAESSSRQKHALQAYVVDPVPTLLAGLDRPPTSTMPTLL